MGIERMPGMVPVRRLRSVSAVGAQYTVDNVFNWSLYDAYFVQWFNAVPGADSNITLVPRTSAPADIGAVFDIQGTRSIVGGAVGNYTIANQTAAQLHVNPLESAGTYGQSGTAFFASAGGSLTYVEARAQGLSAGASALDGACIEGHVRAAVAGFALSAGANGITIARLNVWGLQAGGGA